MSLTSVLQVIKNVVVYHFNAVTKLKTLRQNQNSSTGFIHQKMYMLIFCLHITRDMHSMSFTHLTVMVTTARTSFRAFPNGMNAYRLPCVRHSV